MFNIFFMLLFGCTTSERINNKLGEVDKLYDQAHYSQARDKCEQILIEYPYNKMATKKLKEIYLKLRTIGSNRQRKFDFEDISDIDASEWSQIQGIDFVGPGYRIYKYGD